MLNLHNYIMAAVLIYWILWFVAVGYTNLVIKKRKARRLERCGMKK